MEKTGGQFLQNNGLLYLSNQPLGSLEDAKTHLASFNRAGFNHFNQSQEKKTVHKQHYNCHKACLCELVMNGGGLTSDWMKPWREFLQTGKQQFIDQSTRWS